MDVQQDADEVFEKVKLEIVDHFLPTETVKKEIIFNEKDDKNEIFPIKQENSAEEYTERLQQTFINAGNYCNQDMNDADIKSKLKQENLKKRPTKGYLARRKHIKYWVSHKGILMCKFCGNMYNRKFEMFCHAPQHFVRKLRYMHKANNEHKYGFTKSSKNVLVQNISTNTSKKPFKCDVCSKSFSLKGNLVFHICSHTSKDLFKCNICLKSFSVKTNLVGHMRSHTGEKPFKCGVCSKSFTLKGNLVFHIRSHTGEKPFQCNACSKSFATKSILDRHMRSHTGEKPFQCNVCPKSYAAKRNLVFHMHSHTGEKPFQCDVCSKSYAEKNILVGHMRSHTGEKPFTCEICSKSFANKSGLIKHIHIHTSNIC